MATQNETLNVSIIDAKNKLESIFEMLDSFSFPKPKNKIAFKTDELTEEEIGKIAETFLYPKKESDYIYIPITFQDADLTPLITRGIGLK